ncbi:unnamed protein product, partial [Didymodactylos carnosus]
IRQNLRKPSLHREFQTKSKNELSPVNNDRVINMVACLELEHIPSQTFIVLLGTHLKSKQPFAKDRSEQTNVICQFINEHYSKHSHILLLGDFNGEPIEPFYNQILSTGLLSAYNTLLDHEPEFTTFKFRPGYNENDEKESCHTIDYIFYNPQGFHPLSYLSIPSKTEIGVNGLPSYEYPSDHLALATKFLII